MPHAQNRLANNTCWAALNTVQETQITPCSFELIIKLPWRWSPDGGWSMTEIFDAFRTHLANQDRSQLTINGYLADLEHFGRWFEQTNGEPFSLQAITPVSYTHLTLPTIYSV